tara:strand:+ start:959 stop:1609 length:651 start_codon:yes stop_codon:yes gene_type:complete
MSIIVDQFKKIQSNIEKLQLDNSPKIIAVSKTFSLEHIKPLIAYGHNHFGENKVQEANSKWQDLLLKNDNIKLHMIGKLQTNKVKTAVRLFDYIHSVDSQKLADTLSKCEKQFNKKINYFIQVNIGNENQKSGIPTNEVDQFYTYCSNELKLNIIGLMAIPPQNEEPDKYFEYLSKHNKSLDLKELSMGMTSDYLTASNYSSTFLRIGSGIFGSRN